jgi:hypothetical protein
MKKIRGRETSNLGSETKNKFNFKPQSNYNPNYSLVQKRSIGVTLPKHKLYDHLYGEDINEKKLEMENVRSKMEFLSRK